MICFLVSLISINAQDYIIKLNNDEIFQTIDGFGASDAWRCQFVGLNWPDEKKEQIAKLLFSKEKDESGNPLGIGLSIWRFYIGAGTTEQGEKSGIKNEWRRAESFIDSNGNYDWNKQKGQQWFLKKAKSYGVEKFLAFSISAPVQWTKNGKGYNGDNKDGEINLETDKFDDYSDFMVNVVNHFQSKGITFNYLSPINEPQWDWEKKTQEGTPATNKNILKLTSLLNKDIEKKNLPTKVVIAESADLRWLYSDFGKPNRGSQIDKFSKSISDFQNVESTISGHSYFTTWPVDSLIGIRQKLNKKLSATNLNYWQSEFCILEQTDDIGGGRKRDLGIDTALYVARVMHADLTLANASSWQWWTALTNADFKDGLIYLDSGDKNDLFNLNKIKNDGDFHDSKLLWAFGNFSRFIRPNMVRIDLSFDTDLTLKQQFSDVMLSAYKDKKTNKTVIVAINYSNEDKTLSLPNFKAEKIYTTSKTQNLEAQSIQSKKVTIAARSVSTLTGFVE